MAKLAIAVALIGTVGYDTFALTSTNLTVQVHAQQAATIGHDVLAHQGSVKAAYAAVLRFTQDNGDTLAPNGFVVGRNHLVTVTLTREASTIAADHIPRVKDWVVVTSTSSVSDPK